MRSDRKRKLDELFEAISILAEGAYVFLCDMTEDYSRWSERAVEYFGLPGEYMKKAGEIWESHIHPDDRENYRKSIDAIFYGESSGHDMQYRALAKDGTYTVCTCRGLVISGDNGEPDYFGGAIRNHGMLSYIDGLTGLRSLYGYLDDLKIMLGNNREALHIIVGVNSFSDINDVYGYKFGNRALQRFGQEIKAVFGNVGSVYRLDGTKFAVIAHDVSVERASALYEQLRQSARDLEVEGERLNLSINSGALSPDDYTVGFETFYSCLKYAYYESKHRRLGELVVFDNEVSSENRRSIERLNVIRNSIADCCKGFYLCYQPIVDADTERLKGLEALIRWRNDDYGIVSPDQFIPVLEQDSLFPELGQWIMRQAMNDGRQMLKKYPGLTMNVNLSYTQLEKSDFVADVFRILDETGFPPENLCLEITERCRLLDMERLKNVISLLKERGIKIALDDFGTGFSSLGVLRELDIDTVKIDKAFVTSIEKNRNDQSTVKFISDLAHSFSAEVCAEGVETPGARECLICCSVSSLQGYYYSRPIPADELFMRYLY